MFHLTVFCQIFFSGTGSILEFVSNLSRQLTPEMIMIAFNCDSEPGWFLRTTLRVEGQVHLTLLSTASRALGAPVAAMSCRSARELCRLRVTVPMLHLYDLFHTQNIVQVSLILFKVFWQPVFQCMLKTGNLMFNFGTLNDSMFKYLCPENSSDEIHFQISNCTVLNNSDQSSKGGPFSFYFTTLFHNSANELHDWAVVLKTTWVHPAAGPWSESLWRTEFS